MPSILPPFFFLGGFSPQEVAHCLLDFSAGLRWMRALTKLVKRSEQCEHVLLSKRRYRNAITAALLDTSETAMQHTDERHPVLRPRHKMLHLGTGI